MPTIVTSKIGATNSPTTMDYTTLQAWEDACPVNLVTDDKIWKGECYDQGKFTASVTIGGQTTDSTRYVWLTCASGASFKDKSDVRTSALFYDSATGQGVAIEQNSASYNIRANANYTFIDGIQTKRTGYAEGISLRGTNCTAINMLMKGSGANSTLVDSTQPTNKLINSLLDVQSGGLAAGSQGSLIFCTIIGKNTSAAFYSPYSSIKIKNCAVFGFSSLMFSGTLDSSSNYNSTDLSSITGANSLTSQTFANQFENSTNDFRAKSSGGLKAGTPDTTNAPKDISGTTRDATTPWIGCWENVVTTNRRRRLICGANC